MQSKSADRYLVCWEDEYHLVQLKIRWNSLKIEGSGVYDVMQTDKRMHTSAR